MKWSVTDELTLLVGGNNAATRPGLHALGLPLAKVGLITLDAHFDMRETDQGLRNGNPGMVIASDVEYGDEAWASFDGHAVAVGRFKAGELHPDRVFNRPTE